VHPVGNKFYTVLKQVVDSVIDLI